MDNRDLIGGTYCFTGNLEKVTMPFFTGEVNLNLGCGNNYIDGWVNADCSPNVKKDSEVFIGEKPFPWEDATFDGILACHILEHIPNLVAAKREIIRVLKPGGTLVVIVPDYQSIDAWGDDTHCRAFSYHSFFQPYWPEFDGNQGDFRIFNVKDSLGTPMQWLWCKMVKHVD